MSDDLFSPSSVFWRVNREWLISLAGTRAVLLELAHPLIAEGVARHSDFRGDPFGRLYRTMKTMTDMTFGDASDVRRSLQHFHGCHTDVHGESRELPGQVYDANDPELKFWVLATLIDSMPRVYELLIAPLSDAERCAYYIDAARLGRWLGIAPQYIPPDYAAFNSYVEQMLSGGSLCVTQTAREVTAALFAPPVFGPFIRGFSFVSIGLMPPGLREGFGFSWDAARERRLQRLAALSRRLRPYLPDLLAVQPKAWSQERARRNRSERQCAPLRG